MKSFLDLYDTFVPSNIFNFPIEDCNIIEEYEKNVYIGDKKYLCLVVNIENMNERTLSILMPYMSSKDSGDSFAWVEPENHSYFIDNIENPIRKESKRFVIGFIPYESEFEDFENNQDILKKVKKES